MKLNLARLAASILVLAFCAASISGCAAQAPQTDAQVETTPILSLEQVPGITEEEIAAIEALQQKYDSFSFGNILSTEAFTNGDGTKGGYSALLCDWLSGLFGIPFVLEIMGPTEQFTGLDNGTLDFSGNIMPTEEREEFYYFSDIIAERKFIMIRLKDSPAIDEILHERPIKYAFARVSPVGGAIAALIPGDTYEAVPAEDYTHAYNMLVNGEADAYVATSITEYTFFNYDDVTIEDFYPLIFNPAAMTASKARPELEVVISVVDKAMEGGAYRYLLELYNQGYRDYQKHAFYMKLTDEERAYIATNPVVPIMAYTVNYPLSFYNTHDDEWQGIYFDLLEEVSELSGIEFVMGHDRDEPFQETRQRLLDGDFAVVPEWVPTPETEQYFLRSDKLILTDNFALISRTDFPNITLNEIMHAKVGMAQNTSHARMFMQWFPNHANTVEYPDIEAAFTALQNGEVDMVMSTQRRLMYLTHFQEQSGYKPNVVFNQTVETRLVTHRNYAILLGILDKALQLIDVDGIAFEWTHRTYDYRITVEEVRARWIIGASVLAIILLASAMFVLYKVRQFEKQAASEKMRETEEEKHTFQTAYKRMQAILDILPVGIAIMRMEDGNIEYINKAGQEIYNGGPEDVVGHNGFEFLAETQPDGRATAELIRELWAMRAGVTELQSIKKTGEEFWARIAFCTIDYNGKPAALNAIEDMTAEKEHQEKLQLIAEREQEANQLKSRFLATMSHEIRTPMNAIIGMSELALRSGDSDTKDEHIITVKQAASNLLGIINDILDFSKIEAGKLEIVPGEYNVASLLSDVVSIIRMRVVGSEICFAVKADSNIPYTLFGDETRIRQSVLNILNNAVKYTEKGYVTLGVYMTAATYGDTINLVFEVTDTGVGIKQEDIDKLFTDFTQLDLRGSRDVEGVGLGLAITNNIVKLMGGEISVRSEFGVGSTFTITLPQEVRSRRALAETLRASSKHVLIYVQNETYADSLAWAVRNLHANCDVVNNDAELSQALGKQSYDYLFVSYALLHKGGETMESIPEETKTVVITEFGEVVHDKNKGVLTMPVYCTQIADIFNKVSGNFSDGEAGNVKEGFTAPEARVLLVDDIRTNLKVAEGLLMPYKMQIDLCSGGMEAIEAVKSAAGSDKPYDLVFMDHKMPDIDGIEATKRIRQLGETESYYKQLPIVALTANAVSGMMETFIENGLNDFLSKPIDTVRLNTILEKWLPESKLDYY